MDLGSKEWNEYYHGRNKGHRGIGDQAKRAREAMKASLTKRAENAELDRRATEAEAEADALAQWDADCLTLAAEAQIEAGQRATKANLHKDKALIVRIHAPNGLPKATTEGLKLQGFKWSPRRGGIWWAPRTAAALAVAAVILQVTP